ncbi:PRC-barrel domain-containing protein [Methylobacterium sp. sgz302541]|uniref:PRC-barrel domain-containing protein n=1 Tax=unclassified Methylobacterium TaxID=2615210 RepID=UPI003D342CA3
MTGTLRMIVTATIALWSAMATAGHAAAPGETPQTPTGTAAPAPPPAAPAPATGPAPQAGQQGTPATVLDAQDYESLLGKGVRAANGDDLGRVIDVIIDKDGRPRAAIIDFGGFLGVGSRKIAVDWRSLRFSVDGKVGPVTLTLNRNQVRVSPEYKSGDPIVVLGPAGPSAPPPEGEQAAAPAPTPAPAAQPPAADKPAEKAPDK